MDEDPEFLRLVKIEAMCKRSEAES